MDDRRKNYRAWGALRTAKSRSRRETPCQKTTWCSSCWISSRRWISRSSTSITPRSKDWIDFLRRNMGGMKASSEAETLHRLMRFVPRKTTGMSLSCLSLPSSGRNLAVGDT